MKVYIDTGTKIKIGIPVKRRSQSHTRSEELILCFTPSRLKDMLTVDVDNDRRQYWLTYRRDNAMASIYYISSKEYVHLLEFLKAHDVNPCDQDFTQPMPHRMINPIMELEL